MEAYEPALSRGRSKNVQQRTIRMFDPRDADECPNTHSENKAKAINLMEDIAEDFVMRDNILSKTATTKRDLNQIQRTAVMPPKTADTTVPPPPQQPVKQSGSVAPAALRWVPAANDGNLQEECLDIVEEEEASGGWSSIVAFVQRPHVLVALAAVMVVLAVLVIALSTRR